MITTTPSPRKSRSNIPLAFASGVNDTREIRGFSLAGMPIGASAANLREAAIRELLTVQGPLFLDSGAFSEVRFSEDTQRLEIHALISPREWRRRLAIYLRLARALGERLSVVAPDRVGDQEETLLRLARYRPELQEIAQAGAQILIPLQPGAMEHADFYATAQAATGLNDLVPAFTMKKAATSDAAVARFVSAIQPSRIHLLGMGPTNRRVTSVIAAIAQCSPATCVTMDSNRLRAVTGRDRPLTRQEHTLRAAEIGNFFNDVESPVLSAIGRGLDYTDSISAPSEWASPDMLRRIGMEAGLTFTEISRFRDDPDSFLADSPTPDHCHYWELPIMAIALDRAWEQYVHQEIYSHVRSAAIVNTFPFEPNSTRAC